MVSNHSLKFRIINSQTQKGYNKRMFKQAPVVGIYKELLPMACLRENQQKALAKNQLVGKRQSPQEQREPVVEPQTLKGVIRRHLNL